MSDFKVGDRVQTKINVGNANFSTIGSSGTVIYKTKIRPSILVQFDRHIKGHAGNSIVIIGKKGHCWYCNPEDLEKIEGENMDEKRICARCGKEIAYDEDFEEVFEDGKWVYLCEDCFNEDYYKCSECGAVILQGGEEYISDNGEIYCSVNCAEENGYYQCYDCGDWVHRQDSRRIADFYGDGGERICESCYDNCDWSYCEDCDELFRQEHLERHNGMWLCSSCLDCREDDEYDGICDYHCGPSFRYYKEPHKPDYNAEGFKGYGFELEVDEGGDNHSIANEVKSIMDDEVYCAYDGSIHNGFEIISHPHTREALEAMPINDMLRYLISEGYTSHNAGTCGLHLHASKLLFGDTEEKRIRNISKIVMFYEIFWDDIVKVSRRRQSGIDSWARRYSRNQKDIRDMVDRVIKGGRTEGRYFAVNLCNKHTVEFRLMRGTLKKETFWATMDFLMTTVENASKIPFTKIGDANLWLKGMKPETLDYIRSRGAFASVVGTSEITQQEQEESEE